MEAKRTLRNLFERAKVAHELHFAMALMPEFRGIQDGGWNTAEEALRAYGQFIAHINSIANDDPMRIRALQGSLPFAESHVMK